MITYFMKSKFESLFSFNVVCNWESFVVKERKILGSKKLLKMKRCIFRYGELWYVVVFSFSRCGENKGQLEGKQCGDLICRYDYGFCEMWIHSHSVIHQSPPFVGLWSCLSQYFNSLILGSYHIRNNKSKISNKFLDLSLQPNVCMHILTSKRSKLWCG